MEQVIMEVPATMEGAGGLGQGKLRVTSERLVFERKKAFGGAGDVTSFPLNTIQSAGISGVLDKKLKVRAGSTELVFKSSIILRCSPGIRCSTRCLVIAGRSIEDLAQPAACWRVERLEGLVLPGAVGAHEARPVGLSKSCAPIAARHSGGGMRSRYSRRLGLDAERE